MRPASFADFKTCRAPAIGNAVDAVGCRVFAIESGSSTGISLNSSAFQRARVVLPEPLAPAINVSLGGVTATAGWVAQAVSAAALRESLSAVFVRPQRPPGRPGPSSVRTAADSQP